MRILVTGATGFVGRALMQRLAQDKNISVRGTVRKKPSDAMDSDSRELVVVGDVSADTDWYPALRDIDVIVHTAAHVHERRRHDKHQSAFHEVNAEGTRVLAVQAAKAGVKRMIFLSTIKVNGDRTTSSAFSASDRPAPKGSYALSKFEAEQSLFGIAESSDIEVVVVRPPLVYGPGVRGNFLSMMKWIGTGVPLPFGAVKNKRSLVGLGNLVELLKVCAEHPAAAGNIFLASDGADLSTTDLLTKLGIAMGRKTFLLPIPQGALDFAMRSAGMGEIADRVCGSLRVDISATAKKLDWLPHIPIEEELKRAARAWLVQSGRGS